MYYFIILLGAFILAFQGIGLKRYQKTMNNIKPFLFNGFCYFISFLVSLLFLKSINFPSIKVFILSLLFGFFFVVTIYFYNKCMSLGPVSMSTMFLSLGLVFPVIFSVFYLKEEITIIKIIGFILVLSIIIFSTDFKEKKGNKKFFINSVFLMFFNGILGILQTVSTSVSQKTDEGYFTAFGYLFAFVFALLFYIIISFKNSDKDKLFAPMKSKNFYICALIAGGASGFGVNLIFYTLSFLPNSIAHSISNGSLILFSTILSIIIFKEKLNKKNILILITGSIAIILLSI